jgi:NAD(P)-dependent dehydrogenase (short-subunit alcohol dehydrogenase family)
MGEKLAVVTGGGGLLGVEHAIALQADGFHVLLTDLSVASVEARVAEASEIDSSRLEIAELDVMDEAGVQEFAQRFSSGGELNVLINNAQGSHADDDQDFDRSSLEAWNAILGVGLTGTYICCKTLGSVIANGGSVINMSSIYGVVSPDLRVYDDVEFSSSAAYAAAKAGVVGLTKYLAVYWAGKNVRVNSVSPGGVEAGQPSSFVSAYENRVPMGRMAAPGDLRGVISWLASDKSAYVTGQNIVVDGGLTAW